MKNASAPWRRAGRRPSPEHSSASASAVLLRSALLCEMGPGLRLFSLAAGKCIDQTGTRSSRVRGRNESVSIERNDNYSLMIAEEGEINGVFFSQDVWTSNGMRD